MDQKPTIDMRDRAIMNKVAYSDRVSVSSGAVSTTKRNIWRSR
jgi:hypothetical protein